MLSSGEPKQRQTIKALVKVGHAQQYRRFLLLDGKDSNRHIWAPQKNSQQCNTINAISTMNVERLVMVGVLAVMLTL